MTVGLEAIQNFQTLDNPEWTLVNYSNVHIDDRYDQIKMLDLTAPMTSDPFFIRVWAWLETNAGTGGSRASGDFESGDQNYIRVLWVCAWTRPVQEMYPG